MANIAAPVTGVNAADVAGTVSGTAAGGHDLSMIGLLLHAEPLVLFIMLLLIGMSIACWAIIIEKFAALRSVNEKTNQFENEFWSAEALDKYYEKTKKRKAKHPHRGRLQRDQHHPVRGCDAGVAHHLHGGGPHAHHRGDGVATENPSLKRAGQR